jgi:hypothetical protein
MMLRRLYQLIVDHQWFRPGPRHKTICCDCGAAHWLNTRVRSGHVELQFIRDRRATAAARRWFGFTPDKDAD